ncbi:MAG: pyridoxal phosphate-dependent aminotransferase [Thaumarchaeota archaeon]|nr:pyridoxal phosphate-dependent aminotransferase [Nitrososphaerota archaeon]
MTTATQPGLADRLGGLLGEGAFEILGLAKELERKGHEVVHLEIGEPDFDTPEHIKQAAIDALRKGYTHYTAAPGIYELREAIAERVSDEVDMDVDPNSEVVVMPGAKPGIFSAIMATVNPGDEVIIPGPGWPIYESVTRFAGGIPVFVPLREENDFRLDPAEVRKHVSKKTKLMIINYPVNPTGSTLTKKDIQELAQIGRENNLWVMSDEIYSKIIFDVEHHSLLSEPGMKERTIMIHGFSKTYAMTGWRLGYAVGPASLISHIVKQQSNIASCAAAFSQMAGIAALRGPQDDVKRMVEEYDRRRRVIVSGLNSIKGVSCKMPRGAFYVFPNFKSLGMKSRDLVTLLLNEAYVATLHGSSFGPYGEGYLRMSYAASVEKIKQALEKIGETMEKLSKKPSPSA